jgi:hypothetical protein
MLCPILPALRGRFLFGSGGVTPYQSAQIANTATATTLGKLPARNWSGTLERIDGHIQQGGGDRIIDNGVIRQGIELGKFGFYVYWTGGHLMRPP